MRAGPRRPRVRSHRPARCRYGDNRAAAPARPDARRFVPRNSQVPSPIAGMLAPLASINCIALTQANRSPLCSLPERAANIAARGFRFGWALELTTVLARAANTVSGAWAMTARSALAGPRGIRLPCSQFRMVSTGTPNRAANSSCVSRARRRRSRTARGRCRLCRRGRHGRRERKLLPVPQFDDPSVRFQPQALHVRLQARKCRRCALRLD